MIGLFPHKLEVKETSESNTSVPNIDMFNFCISTITAFELLHLK